jgi:hypothetical protein
MADSRGLVVLDHQQISFQVRKGTTHAVYVIADSTDIALLE